MMRYFSSEHFGSSFRIASHSVVVSSIAIYFTPAAANTSIRPRKFRMGKSHYGSWSATVF